MEINDDFGNKIVVEIIPPFGTRNISLILPGQKREIGVINPGTKTLYIKRNPKRHLLRALDAYGFNHELIENRLFDYEDIVLTIGSKRYYFNRDFVKENGVYHHHMKGGFELQLFVGRLLILKQPNKAWKQQMKTSRRYRNVKR